MNANRKYNFYFEFDSSRGLSYSILYEDETYENYKTDTLHLAYFCAREKVH